MAKVNLGLLLRLHMRLADTQKEIWEAEKGGMFCKVCGKTNPEGGFYPLWSMGSHEPFGGWTCNPCNNKIRQDIEARAKGEAK